jgi:hypothetical protein
MAKISIEIDTENGDLKKEKEGVNLTGSRGRTPLTADKLGILSSIKMTTKLLKAIRTGYGGPYEYEDNIQPNNYTDLTNKKNILTSKQCTVFATVGGLWANTGLSGTTLPFVSMVGYPPSTPDNYCFGGISLESWPSNAQRRKYLTDNAINLNQIGLYHSPPPAGAVAGNVPWDEEYEWNHSGAGAVIPSTGNFGLDLNGVPAGIRALVIGASPLFLYQNNMSLLVSAANAWLAADLTRFVVYPLQIYSEAAPAAARSILIGPDLYNAHQLLGLFASIAAGKDGRPGFFQTVPNITHVA